MANNSPLTFIGWNLSLFGSILILISGLTIVMGFFSIQPENLETSLLDLLKMHQNVKLVYGIVIILIGTFILWTWKNKKDAEEINLLKYGLIFLVLGSIGILTLVSIFIILAGILFIIDSYFDFLKKPVLRYLLFFRA
ncbi:MAG: hypothetical protein ACW981_04590 [Candidatus Hodarchaeales archaeon]|jgi:uncharacterized membrane protein YidH (DUF202 family)